MACPPLENLIAFTRGTIGPEEKERIADHLAAGCTACEKNQTWGSAVSGLLASDTAVDFPEDLIQWSVAQFKVHSRPEESSWKRWVARLVFDSRLGQPQAAARSAAVEQATSRQLLYRTRDYDVDLTIEPADAARRVRISGQILANGDRPFENATVRLFNNSREIAAAHPDQVGVFHLEGVAEGIYDIICEMGSREILLSGIEVAASGR